MNLSDTFIVSGNFRTDGVGVLIVGKQTKGKVEIVNAYQDAEAFDIFRKLCPPDEKTGWPVVEGGDVVKGAVR
jgi:hypothetical protein